MDEKKETLSAEGLKKVTGGAGADGYKYSFRSNDWVYSDPMKSCILVIDEDADPDEDMAPVKERRMKNGDAWSVIYRFETFHAKVMHSDFERNGGKLAAMS